MLTRLGIAALVAVLVGVAAAGGQAEAQPVASLSITSPAQDASVTSPVTVSVSVEGAALKPATEGDASSVHLHYFVDVDPATVVQPGGSVPTGRDDIIHTADTSRSLELAAGQHTVWVVIGDVGHVPLGTPDSQAEVSFTVTAATSLPSAGSDGSLQAGGSVSVPGMALLGAALALLAAGLVGRRLTQS